MARDGARLAARLCAVLLCLALPACGQAPAGGEPKTGLQVWREQGCGLCHGDYGLGTRLGPDLRGKAAFWTRPRLVAFLQDPQRWIDDDERLRLQARQYSQQMLPFRRVPQAELEAVAEFVLTLPQPP